MKPYTSILNDIDLDAVTGGSAGSAFLQGIANGVANATGGTPPHFGVAPTTGTGGTRPCGSNHNGVIYPM
jgi:hypothetical protein